MRSSFCPCSPQKPGSYVVMHSLHQLCFVFNLIPASPRYLCQNLSSEIFNWSGFLPRREAPGISFSVRNVGFEMFEILATANEEGRNAKVWPF